MMMQKNQKIKKSRSKYTVKQKAILYLSRFNKLVDQWIPTQPLASTRACAVVGVEGTIRPIRDLLELALGRGVTEEGKGTETGLDVRVIAEGVHVEKVGEGGKTNSVWEGVCKSGLCVFGACEGCTG
jgi:hypothetical protein